MKSLTFRLFFIVLAGSLALQSYQCSSPDFTTGKSKFNNRDFAGANDYLTKETQKNPSNAEAWLLLARTRKALNPPDFQGAANALAEAEKNAAKQATKDEVARESYYLWVDLYNAGINEYNDFFKNPGKYSPEKVSSILDMAAQLRPENSDVYTLSASVYLESKDTARALNYLSRYVEAEKDNYDFAVAKRIFVGTKHSDALSALGTPVSSKGQRYGKDSVIVDKYSTDGKEVYVFSALRNNNFIVEGWRNGSLAARVEAEKERFSPFDVRPYMQIAAIYYNRKEYDLAMKFVNSATGINPHDEQTTALRTAIYEAQGKTKEMLQAYEQLLQAEPNNYTARTNYGAALNRSGDYDKAIEQFNKVLSADPNNDHALFNTAAAYKNKASEIQKTEKQKFDANPKYKENEEAYFPILQKSAEYFERYKNIPTHRTEFAALQQLANIYEVIRDKTKLKIIIAELEAVEYANAENPAYYNLMGSLYAKQNQLEKSKKYFDKETELLKK